MGFTSEAEVGRVYGKRAVEFIRNNPGTFLRLCWVRWLQFWKIWSPRAGLLANTISILSFGTLLALCVAGLATRAGRAEEAMLLAALTVLLSLVHAVDPSIVRYRLPVEPLMIAMAAPVVLRGWNVLSGRLNPAARAAG